MIRKITPLIIALILLFPLQNQVFAQNDTENPVYIVQPGENLTQIATKFNITVQELITANNITNANLISEGTQLIIPGIEGVSGILITQPVSFGDSYKNILIVIRQDDTVLSSAIRAGENHWILEKVIDEQKIFIPGDIIFYAGRNGVNNETIFSENISTIEIAPLPFTQGHTTVVYIYANQPGDISGQIDEKQISFFPSDDNTYYYSLHGVHAMENPGLSELKLSGVFDNGDQFDAAQMVLISSGGYGQETLTVEKTMIEKDVNEHEYALVQEIVTVFTSERKWEDTFRFPVEGSISDSTIGFTSYYGNRRSYNNGQYFGFHGGLDFKVVLMSLNIYASASGTVVYAGDMDIRGNTIFIDHGQGVFSGYAHMNQFFVNTGDFVEAGQLIGEIGKTGRVTGPHLHWDIWVNGNQVEPFDLVNNQFP